MNRNVTWSRAGGGLSTNVTSPVAPKYARVPPVIAKRPGSGDVKSPRNWTVRSPFANEFVATHWNHSGPRTFVQTTPSLPTSRFPMKNSAVETISSPIVRHFSSRNGRDRGARLCPHCVRLVGRGSVLHRFGRRRALRAGRRCGHRHPRSYHQDRQHRAECQDPTHGKAPLVRPGDRNGDRPEASARTDGRRGSPLEPTLPGHAPQPARQVRDRAAAIRGRRPAAAPRCLSCRPPGAAARPGATFISSSAAIRARLQPRLSPGRRHA